MTKLITITGKYVPNKDPDALRGGGTTFVGGQGGQGVSIDLQGLQTQITQLDDYKVDRNFVVWPDTSTSLPFTDYPTIQTTITGNRTFTTTGTPTAGQPCWLVLCSSGTTAYTVDFSTGFVSDGSLSTGTVDGVCKVLAFISTGNPLIEYTRTGGMVAPTPTPTTFTVNGFSEVDGGVTYLNGTVYLKNAAGTNVDSHLIDYATDDSWTWTDVDVSVYVDFSGLTGYDAGVDPVDTSLYYRFSSVFVWVEDSSTPLFNEARNVFIKGEDTGGPPS